MRERIISAVCTILIASSATAADVYLIRFNAVGKDLGCASLVWHDEAIFFNRGTALATVKILGMSDGVTDPLRPTSFTVPPGAAVLSQDVLDARWTSFGRPAILHLDVPAGLIVESRNAYYLRSDCLSPRPGAAPGSLGHAAMPVYTAVTAAQLPQIHLGTDLGERESRVNIGIYNAGPVAAMADVQLRRTCDNSVVDQRIVTVPPNATVQVGLFGSFDNVCERSSDFTWSRYTVVTVDQPSITFVSNLATRADIFFGFAPTVDLAMPHGTSF